MVKRLVALFAVLALVAVAGTASAQMWRGTGRVAGKVMDEAGKPIDGVKVRAYLPAGNGGTDTTTNKKGEFGIGGINSGAWQLDFVKEGFETRRVTIDIEQITPKPPMDIVMKKAAPDPNQIVAGEMKKAAGFLGEKKFAEAQAVYADLLAKFPQAFQIELAIARAYHAEGVTDKTAFAKEIEHLKKYLEKDPTNLEVKLLTGAEMIQVGNPEEGKAMLASVDDAAVKDPMLFVNVGINLMNQNKAKDALPFFERAIARFPESPDAYYYRGLTNVQFGTTLRPDNPTEGDKLLAAGKADLAKFVQMAPNAPEAAAAQKMLEALK
ncbi:MAG TPA: carboxypeptidase regulatory-like domain-containing protein [Vicinamibacterales bacterium]|jgi:tetratricopeptide (TPR) repeat protein